MSRLLTTVAIFALPLSMFVVLPAGVATAATTAEIAYCNQAASLASTAGTAIATAMDVLIEASIGSHSTPTTITRAIDQAGASIDGAKALINTKDFTLKRFYTTLVTYLTTMRSDLVALGAAFGKAKGVVDPAITRLVDSQKSAYSLLTVTNEHVVKFCLGVPKS